MNHAKIRIEATLFVATQVQTQPMVLPNSTVVIGYCFGGTAVLDLAASWPAMTDGVLGTTLARHNCSWWC